LKNVIYFLPAKNSNEHKTNITKIWIQKRGRKETSKKCNVK